MTDKEIIIDGCEFQSDCIEYKDISYLKIMPICAIHELSIACHDKVNKCKYYKLYKQLKHKEQECEELKEDIERWKSNFNGKVSAIEELLQQLDQFKVKNEGLKHKVELMMDCASCKVDEYKQTLTEIKEIAENREIFCENCTGGVEDFTCNDCGYVKILQKISQCEVKNDR